MKTIYLLIVTVCSFVSGLCSETSDVIGAQFAEKIDKFYKEADTAYRIRVAAIYPGVTIDPPLQLKNFLLMANFTLLLDAPSSIQYARNLKKLVAASDWIRTESGVPSWYWSLVDAEGVSHLDVLIDYPDSRVKVKEQWYRVSPTMIEALTKDVVKFGSQELTTNPKWQK